MAKKDLEQRVLAVFKQAPYELLKQKALAKRLKLESGAERESLAGVLASLVASRQLRQTKRGKFGLADVHESLEGIFLTTKREGSVVETEDGVRIAVIPGASGSALHGDRVEIQLVSLKGKHRRERAQDISGRVTSVVKRARETLVGTIHRERAGFYVEPDDKRIGRIIAVSKKHVHDAADGDKVIVRITDWGGEFAELHGEIAEVLGAAGEVGAEFRSVVNEFALPLAFPPEPVAEADAFPPELPEEEIARRLDFRGELCVTIDPEDARDFDDAVSLQMTAEGLYKLGVHIADVSHYVTEGSALDREALERGTSVYLPSAVIPMLPERLSNDLCSLKPMQDRFAFSVFMVLGERGAVKSYEIVETVIRSRRRFAYEEVERILTGGEEAAAGEDPAVVDMLRTLDTLARMLTKKRLREGSIDFETAEVKFRFDAEGNPVEIIKKQRLHSHRLIEECMLLANRTVARHIGVPGGQTPPKPFLFRVHDAPAPERLEELAMFVRQFGYTFDAARGVSAKTLQRLLEDVRGSKEENVINEIALRSMAKAVYSETNIGHFGLSFEYYSHFTSPIRRYPDLVVHRLLKEYAGHVHLHRQRQILERLKFIAKHSSDRERVAMEAERTAVKVMQVEYMRSRVGERFQAIVSGVVKFGLFVELNDLLVEGMVHVREMDDDYYVFDERQYALIGRESRARYRLGDELTVKLVRVDPQERMLDFVIIRRARGPEGERNRGN